MMMRDEIAVVIALLEWREWKSTRESLEHTIDEKNEMRRAGAQQRTLVRLS